MRILHVFDFFSPEGGGTIVLIYQLVNKLALNGHEVTLYTSDSKLDKDFLKDLKNINIKIFRCWSSFLGFYFMPGLIPEVRNRLKYYDVIHLHCFRSFQNIIICYYAKKYKIPYIIDAHGSAKRSISGARWDLKYILKLLFDIAFGYGILKGSSKLIAESEFGIKEYAELGVNANNIVLFRSTFDIEEFSKLPERGTFRKKYKIKQRHIICFLGRIHWIKGIDFLVESFNELVRERDDVILVIVGPDDGYKSTLETLIDTYNLGEKVLFTGILTGKYRLAALTDATMLVQTSRSEQGARVPFEAILCDTPIIVSSNNGAGEDVREIDAGYLVEWGNVSELKYLMEMIIDNPSQAAIKTRNAKEYIINNLSINTNVNLFQDIYRECIETLRNLK